MTIYKIIIMYLTCFKKIISNFRFKFFDLNATKSYSQEGEDMILKRIFEGQKNGFYVDVGAHHPRRFSNTYYFYKQGWSGINIEPNPNALDLFNADRPRDLNLRLGISSEKSVIKYYYYDEPAVNTFDKSTVEKRFADKRYPYNLILVEDVAVDRLDNILKKYLPVGINISFLTIDVEGLDMEVLRSNDWQLFRPKYVLAELLNTSLEEALKSKLVMFMLHKKYALYAKTKNTLIFYDKEKTIFI
jgi:FkbM family methyltransferase